MSKWKLGFEDFLLFCQQSTDDQLCEIYRKEREAQRLEYAEIAKAVAKARGIESEY